MHQTRRLRCTYVDVEKSLLVIDTQSAPELSFAQEVIESDACSNRDTRSKLLPSVASIVEGGDQLLVQVS